MIQHFIITVLVIYGIHGSTRGGMLLAPFALWLESLISGKTFNSMDCTPCVPTRRENIAYYTIKMLFNCTPCMASIYGTISFFLVEFPTQGLVGLPVWVFSLCGFNYILNKSLNRR